MLLLASISLIVWCLTLKSCIMANCDNRKSKYLYIFLLVSYRALSTTYIMHHFWSTKTSFLLNYFFMFPFKQVWLISTYVCRHCCLWFENQTSTDLISRSHPCKHKTYLHWVVIMKFIGHDNLSLCSEEKIKLSFVAP